MMKFLCLILSFTFVSSDDNFLKNFKICNRSDPKLNQCLKDGIQEALQFLKLGIPEFNIPSMQPLEIPEWVIDPTKSIPFFQKYKNVRVYNSEDFVIDELEADITDTEVSIALTGKNPLLKVVCSYNYENAILFGMDISGKGTMVLLHYGNSFTMNIKGNAVKDGTRTKLLITEVQFLLDVEKFDITYEHRHLELSKEKTAHTNKHVSTIYEEMQMGYSQLYAVLYKNIADSVFAKLDFDEVFPK